MKSNFKDQDDPETQNLIKQDKLDNKSQEDQSKTERPLFAALSMLMSVVFVSTCLFGQKLVQEIEPGTSPFVILMMRSTAVFTMLTPFVYQRQSIQKSVNLAPNNVYLGSFFGQCYEALCCHICVTALPVVNVSILKNLAPLFTVLLAIWILNEKLSMYNALQASAMFLGVMMIILARSKPEDLVIDQKLWHYWVLLLMLPIIMASCDFQTQKLGKAKVDLLFFPYCTNFILAITSAMIVLATGTPLPQNPMTWLLITAVLALSFMALQIFKVIAYQNGRITRVAPILYFDSVFCFLADLIFFNEQFQNFQLIGIFIVFAGFFANVVKAYVS